MGAHPIDPLPADLSGAHRTEPVPPITDRLVADVDAALVQQVLDVAQRQRVLTYIITTRRITSGDELKYRNGLAGLVVMPAGRGRVSRR
jgi:hypothetical protein